jgi:hypothetical protein
MWITGKKPVKKGLWRDEEEFCPQSCGQFGAQLPFFTTYKQEKE